MTGYLLDGIKIVIFRYMSSISFSTLNANNRNWILVIAVIFCVISIAVVQDVLQSIQLDYNFYLSESLIYKSFYLLFIPFIFLLRYCIRKALKNNRPIDTLLIVIVPLLAFGLHLVLYPILVILLSSLFLDHTYRYFQVFDYALSGLSGYGFMGYLIIAYFIYFAPGKPAKEHHLTPYISKIIVKVKGVQTFVKATEVAYFKTEKPYIAIHTQGKILLYTTSLKDLQLQLNPSDFIRIHKSVIVNLRYIKYLKSRKNGDYDLFLIDSTKLRLSRNYLNDFKSRFQLPS